MQNSPQSLQIPKETIIASLSFQMKKMFSKKTVAGKASIGRRLVRMLESYTNHSDYQEIRKAVYNAINIAIPSKDKLK